MAIATSRRVARTPGSATDVGFASGLPATIAADVRASVCEFRTAAEMSRPVRAATLFRWPFPTMWCRDHAVALSSMRRSVGTRPPPEVRSVR
jgi:hypothetical protein